jgi:uncharacterized membrane protein YeaQ/YmgE (transglycosylase-associated protein family)
MSCLAWIVLGLVAGFIGSKIVNKTGEGILLDIMIMMGIVGAVGADLLKVVLRLLRAPAFGAAPEDLGQSHNGWLFSSSSRALSPSPSATSN